MKVLHVDSSPKNEKSNSRLLSAFFVDRLRETVDTLSIDCLDLVVEYLPHVSAAFAAATYAPAKERSTEMQAVLARSDGLCARLLAAGHARVRDTDVQLGHAVFVQGLCGHDRAHRHHLCRSG
jgi:FMN-dependent NADH-azoreductase